MSGWRLVSLTTVVVLLVSCSSAPKADDPAAQEASAAARILAIPPAQPGKNRGMIDMKNWRNPYLIVKADGVALLDTDNHEEHLLKPEELTQALARLPASAWPYGRVVVVTENGVVGQQEDMVQIRKNRALVAGTLESLHVLINWVPSA
jgi:hypothetical protein